MAIVSSGYQPSRDHMAVIVRAASELYRVARRWQRHVRLPGYPIEMGNLTASEALFNLERALNPDCFAWEDPSRKPLNTRFWSTQVGVGLAWLRNLLDLVIERNQLQTLASEACWTSWSVKERSIPNVVAIGDEELTALGQAIRLLPNPRHLPDSSASELVKEVSGQTLNNVVTVEDAPLPVILTGLKLGPWVLGKQKKQLTPPQFRVVKALLDAGENGLKMAALKKISDCSDAVNVLKRLANTDPDWKAVIWLPGKSRTGYHIARPATDDFSSQKTPEDHALKGRSTPIHSTTP